MTVSSVCFFWYLLFIQTTILEKQILDQVENDVFSINAIFWLFLKGDIEVGDAGNKGCDECHC